MASAKLITSSVVLCYLAQFLLVARAEVDGTSPDLSRFKLNHVDQKLWAQERATRPIVDLGWAARSLNNAFYTTNPSHRCPAYSYLFKLIKQQGVKLRQDKIEALALVTHEDHLFYGALMSSNPKFETELFIEAMESMGKDTFAVRKDSWETYLELIRCAAQFLGGNTRESNPRLYEYLRSNGKLQIAMNCYEMSELRLRSQVKDLIKKFDQQKFNEAKEANLKLAREIIGKIYIPEVREFEEKLNAGEVSLRELKPSEMKDELQAQAKDEDKRREEAMIQAELEEEAKEIELLNPTDDKPDSNSPGVVIKENDITAGQLMVLRLLAMRIMNYDAPRLRYERAPKISMSTAIDFNGNWMLLEEAKLNPRTEIGAQGMLFRKDPVNKAIAVRVKNSVENYTKVTKLVGHLQELLSIKGKMTDLNQMREAHSNLVQLLDRIDPAFDVDDIRRMANNWNKKLFEYNTMQKFIDFKFL